MRLPHTMCVARVRGGTSRGCWDTLISHVHGKGITFIGSNLDHQACQVLMDLYRPFAVNRMLNYANNYLWIVSDMCNETYYHVLSSIPICPPKKQIMYIPCHIHIYMPSPLQFGGCLMGVRAFLVVGKQLIRLHSITDPQYAGQRSLSFV